MKRILTFLLTLTVLFSGISVYSTNTYAADGTVKIFLGDSDTPRHHKAIKEGELSEALSFELNEGTVKSSSFTSGNTALFQIVKENGKTYVKAIKEGTGYVTLTVVNNSDKVFKERLFISVYKDVEKCMGIINRATDGYRGASDNADVEKEDAKGKITKGTKVDIIASCLDYYLIKTKDGRLFEDELDTAFIKKKDLEIPVTSIKILDKDVKIEVGGKRALRVAVEPSISTEKTYTWESRKKEIASVSADGVVTAKRAGNTTVSVRTKSGASATRKIVVPEIEKHKWKKVKDLKDGSVDKMQGLTGYKDTVFFFKIKKTEPGPKGKTKKAVLYRAKITKKGKIKNIKALKSYKREVGHANGMAAVGYKKSNKIDLYIAPGGERKGNIVKIKVTKNKASKAKLIKCTGKDMKGASYSSISDWKYYDEQYFIIRSGRNNFVCKEDGGEMKSFAYFSLIDPYEPKNDNKTRGQGTACDVEDNIYYYVNSFAYEGDFTKKSYGRISYVFRYKLSFYRYGLVVTPEKHYMLKATNQVSKKRNKKNIKRFEMEDLYIYNGYAYLNSEGSNNCLDLIGKFKR